MVLYSSNVDQPWSPLQLLHQLSWTSAVLAEKLHVSHRPVAVIPAKLGELEEEYCSVKDTGMKQMKIYL